MSQQVINIFTEETPNPETLKFVATKMLYNGSIDFENAAAAEHSPLAKELFKLNFVEGVFVAANFITITKKKDIEWVEIQNIIRESIKSMLEQNVAITEKVEEKVEFKGSEVEIKIQQILHDYVRPAVESDGGAIQFKKFDEGKVTLQMQGACSGCPSSTITLKQGIENLLKRMVPEVTEVISEV
jgi:NFU1 iron-sulfur cluster scaffold homolog, mitochondrial